MFEVAWGQALAPAHPAGAVWGAAVAGGWAPGWGAGCWSCGACPGPVAGVAKGCVCLALGMCLCPCLESSDPLGGQEVGFLVLGVPGQVSSQLHRRVKTGSVRQGAAQQDLMPPAS